jgi:hypothetical protein
MLQKYDWTDDWYLGKPSIKAPLEILDREHIPVIRPFFSLQSSKNFSCQTVVGIYDPFFVLDILKKKKDFIKFQSYARMPFFLTGKHVCSALPF